MQQITGKAQPNETDLYAAAYRSIVLEKPQVEVWFENLKLGQLLPTLPLWLKDGECYPIDLAQTYDRTITSLETCDRSRCDIILQRSSPVLRMNDRPFEPLPLSDRFRYHRKSQALCIDLDKMMFVAVV
jgi:hypothetical protein